MLAPLILRFEESILSVSGLGSHVVAISSEVRACDRRLVARLPMARQARSVNDAARRDGGPGSGTPVICEVELGSNRLPINKFHLALLFKESG